MDHIKAGLFDLVCLLPSAATWSRVRHSESSGQPPLRTRAFPLGLSSLAPLALQKVRTDNLIIEAISCCAEQTLLSQKSKLFLMFPEDLGGHSQEGPTSIWALREFQSLHGINDACRGAGFPCQLGHAKFRRPVGVLTNIASLFDKLYRGWPLLSQCDNDLKYRGSLPNHCPCVPQLINLRGVDVTDHCISASSSTLGERFWSWIFGFFLSDGLSSSLRDGGISISTFRSTSSSSSWSPILAVSLASGACSLRMFYDSWKTRHFHGFQSRGGSFFLGYCILFSLFGPVLFVYDNTVSTVFGLAQTLFFHVLPHLQRFLLLLLFRVHLQRMYLAVHGLAHPELRKRP